MKNKTSASLFALLPLIALSITTAQASPALSSRPNAAYTLYLDFDGFTFNGQWGGGGNSPGTTNPYGSDPLITDTWSRISEKYSGFDVNVTTVDPAIAAGQASSDASRQLYYDNTARIMHTIIGNNSDWFGAAGGVSYVGVAQYSYSGTGFSTGYHTNWAFANYLANASKYIADATTHEDGHGLSLNHQSDYMVNDSNVNEYSSNNGASGFGSFAPNMGVGYYSQRGTWRVGTLNNGSLQNDVLTILQDDGMSLVDDGIGHSFTEATSLSLIGTVVDSTMTKGFINPASSSNPNPIGIDNYTKDYFKFTMGEDNLVSFAVTDGGDWITPGLAADGATLRSKMNIYQNGNLLSPLGFGTESVDTLSETFSGFLTAGDYYVEITSAGGYQSTYDATAKYYEMGSYVLTGSGITSVVVPEAGTFVLLGAGLLPLVGMIARRRKS